MLYKYFTIINKHNYKYLNLGAVIIAVIAVNNYDSILSFFHLKNYQFAKKLLKDKRSLDTAIKIEIPKDIKIKS